MNNEQLRNMIENQSLEAGSKAAELAHVKAKANMVVDMILSTLSEEFENACGAEDMDDYFFKVCDYVRKPYVGLMEISDECWRDYISNVGWSAECSTRLFITANHERFESDELNRVSYMIMINNDFSDFVYKFYTLLHSIKKKCDANLDIEK